MSGSNALQIADPNADNPLAQAPSWADAAQSVAGTVSSGVDALGQWLAAQRAKSSQMGLWDPNTGLPTGAGVVSAAGQYSNALLMGTTAPGIRAFHGSPYDFERFDTSKIGTGEGAQAYGHGLYFAEGEGTARSYRDALAERTYQTATGPDTYSNVWSALHNAQIAEGVHPNIAAPVATNVRNMIDEAGSIDKALETHDIPSGGSFGPAYQAAIDAAKRMQLATNPGKMYEVNIGADPEQFLHWDKPLSEQSPQVQQALSAWNAQRPADQQLPTHVYGQSPRDLVEPSGQGIYQHFSSVSGNDVAAGAKALQDAGIPGIRYLDQGSRNVQVLSPQQTTSGQWITKQVPNGNVIYRGDDESAARAAGEGTHNYVVFDANTIDILRKYGLAGLGIGLGAAATNGSQQQPPMAQ